jgi:rubrerythrin
LIDGDKEGDMSILGTLKETFEASTESPNREESDEEVSAGAYWCDDCGVRLRDTEVESDSLDCPDCGGEMRFERSMSSTGCAC